MEKSVKKIEIPKCPYLVSRAKKRNHRNVILMQNQDFAYDDKHEVIIVDKGENDLIKEVNSHAGEVGLVNAVKLAIAHGEDPYTTFMKTEDGIEFAVDPDATLDELIESSKLNDAKIHEMSKMFGVSDADLMKAINDGSINQMITDFVAKQENKEGDAEHGTDDKK